MVPQQGVGTHERSPTPPHMLEDWLAWWSSGLQQITEASVSSGVQLSRYIQKKTVFLFSFLTSGSYGFSALSSKMVPELCEEGWGTDVPFVTGHSTVMFSALCQPLPLMWFLSHQCDIPKPLNMRFWILAGLREVAGVVFFQSVK